MGEGCRLVRYRKWNHTSNFRYHCTIISLLLTVIFLSTCSAQDVGGVGREGSQISSSGNPCLPEKYVVPLRTAFQKLIPIFNSHNLLVQLRTDTRIQMGPEDTKLVPFLRAYYPTVIKELRKPTPPNRLSQTSMLLYFNTEYSRFLIQTGVPLSCLSYFVGVTDEQQIMQLQQLSQNLQKRFKSDNENHAKKSIFGVGVTGQQIIKLLKIKETVAFTPSEYLKDKTRDQAICEEILLYLKDGSIMIKLPISNLEMKSMYIPSFKSSLQLGQVEVPYQLGRYISIGLNCLDRTEEKKNFIEKVLEWASTKLIPQIVQSPTCLRGFGGILPFMASIQEYENTFDRSVNTVETEIKDERVQTSNDYNPPEYHENPPLADSYSSVQKIRGGQNMIAYNLPIAAEPPQPNPVIDLIRRNQPTPIPSVDLLKKRLKNILDNDADDLIVMEVEEEKKPHSVWFLTVVLLFVLLMVLLWLYFMLTGTRLSDIQNWCRKAGMRVKNKRRNQKHHHRRRYEEPTAPLLTQTTTDGATSDDGNIMEKPDSVVHSRRDLFWDNSEADNLGTESKPTPKKIKSKTKTKKDNRQKQSSRSIVVKAPVSDGESIKLIITTDAEDCDCDENKSCVIRETSGGEDIYISELDF